MTEIIAHNVQQEPEIAVSVASARIAWVLAHPHMSEWLKAALRSALTVDPVVLQNDVEMLRHLLDGWAFARVQLSLSPTTADAALVAQSVG